MKTLRVCLACLLTCSGLAVGQEHMLELESPQTMGLSGFRAHWDQPIPVAENGQRVQRDAQVKDRGQTAVWDGVQPGPLAFDAVHRSLLVRFPDAAEKIAAALAAGKTIEKVTLILPYLDEELWPSGSRIARSMALPQRSSGR